jgi:hypothetical protein
MLQVAFAADACNARLGDSHAIDRTPIRLVSDTGPASDSFFGNDTLSGYQIEAINIRWL